MKIGRRNEATRGMLGGGEEWGCIDFYEFEESRRKVRFARGQRTVFFASSGREEKYCDSTSRCSRGGGDPGARRKMLICQYLLETESYFWREDFSSK